MHNFAQLDICHGVAIVMLSCAECKVQSMQQHVVVKGAHCKDLLSRSDCHSSVLLLLCHQHSVDWWTHSFPSALCSLQHKLAEQLCTFQEEDRKELSLRAIVGLSPEQQGQIEDAAGQAEDKYRQAGHAAADQAEQGADAATAQVNCCTDYACKQLL